MRKRVFLGSCARRLLTLMLSILLLSGSVPAQVGSSSVRGTVLDPQGKALAGATVSLTNPGINFTRTAKTNETGGYIFDLIPPGTYSVEAEYQGFKKAAVTDVRALVDKPTTVDLQLEVGNLTETVTVSAGAGDVLSNTTDATIGNNFVSQQIVQLPLESRNVVQLLSLQPGVTPDGYVSGSRADQANITLDGVDVNEQQSGVDPRSGQAFSSVLRVTPDSIQEFRVTTSTPNATQGRSSGAQVSLITRSGTNVLSGNLFWAHRNTATTANNFFNNRTIDPVTGQSIPRPKLIRNLFGGSLGGPILKDRAFFFYNYEGRRDAAEQSVVRTVPLASLGRGEVRFLNAAGSLVTLTAADINRLFPAVGVNPVGLAVLADAARRYPANDPTAGDGLNTGGFRFNASRPVRLNTHTAKLDFNLTNNQSLFIRGNYQQDHFAGAPQFPDTPSPDFWSHPVGLAVGHTWTLTNTLVNRFTYGFTREAFTSGGDSTENAITFRFVFSPRLFQRELSRTTPVHNFTDDVSYVRGVHNFQFGTNVRLISNNRVTFANAFDDAVANPSFYDASGAVLSRPISGIGPGWASPVRNAVSAVVGRFSQYSGNFNFDREGNLLPVGTGIGREFATQEYDWYMQDVWKLRPNLTVTLGLRYGLSRPVYETSGLQVKPTTSLSEFFKRRVQGAKAGTPVNDLITVDLAGPANGKPGYYPWDKNNFQPRLAVAWSPDFKSGILGKLFGSNGASVLRGGFGITNDYFGQQLAVQFDLNSTLGFASTTTIAANTYNVTTRPAPRFTGFGQDIRSLPGITIPSNLTFPLVTPADEAQRIESSLDDNLVSPIHYSWSASFGRQLKGGLFIEASYIGRKARNLLITRDIMHLNDLVDPKSGVDWYTAAGMLADLRAQNVPVAKVKKIPYFENLFPSVENFFVDLPASYSATQRIYAYVARDPVEGADILDWTFVQSLIDDFSSVGPNAFFHPQYAALAAFSTLGESDYHAGTLTVRQRLRNHLTLDFNYTLSKSMDNASGLQNSDVYGSAFVLNPLDLKQQRGVSDFDIRHIINMNAVWELPVGRGRAFLSGMPGFAEAILGGWQLTNIWRWNSGIVAGTPFDAAQWATNWNAQSNGVRIKPITASPTRGGKNEPNLFSDPVAAYQSFRNARAGEVGDRNVFRLPNYWTIDMGLGKTFTMPYNENHKLVFRWEVFNVANFQPMGTLLGGREGFGLGQDPNLTEPSGVFGNFTDIHPFASPRVMQFGLRYQF
ncbi:MAG: carboxypeptidase regulatory-like domain-containing protein [Blastocatellia bacterium]